jgi:hypothetical protein
MTFKCSYCQRTFSRRSSYTRHNNKCMLTAELIDESSESESPNILSINNSNKYPETFDNIECSDSNVSLIRIFNY